MILRLIFTLLLIGFSAHPVLAGSKQLLVLSGRTMGTVYTIKLIPPASADPDQSLWQKRVEMRLKEVNQRLSMYDTRSELSRFNQAAEGDILSISRDFLTVLKQGAALYELTRGAWDGTVKPLVDLWGFGTKGKTSVVPDPQTLQRALLKTGFNHILILSSGQVIKKKQITLDLGSIAKGFGVDTLGSLFKSFGISDYLIEIGGELAASGTNIRHKPWTVGISRPDPALAGSRLHTAIRLKDKAIATSGNYRNFYQINGRTVSHIIDPKTGFPVSNRIVSASVISDNCTFADGLATALMVMDVKQGIALVNRMDHTECLIVQKIGAQYVNHASRGFKALIVK